MFSAVLIVPAADRDAANALGESMGWGPNNYSVPLTTDGTGITHWGCRADVTQGFLDMLANPSPEAEPIVAVLIYDISETLWGRDHFDTVLAAQGMTIFDETSEA